VSRGPIAFNFPPPTFRDSGQLHETARVHRRDNATIPASMNALACAFGASVLDIATAPRNFRSNERTDGRARRATTRETTVRLMIPSRIPRKRHPDIRVCPVRKIKPADAQASHQVGLASPRERSRTCNFGIANSRTCPYYPRLIANQRNSAVFENSPRPPRAFRICRNRHDNPKVHSFTRVLVSPILIFCAIHETIPSLVLRYDAAY